MDSRHCSDCYYNEMCQCDNVCDEHIKIDEQTIDEEVELLIEKRREAFREEWFEYIKDFN